MIDLEPLPKLCDEITKSWWVIIGSGESYNAETVSGEQLLEKWIEWLYGDVRSFPRDELERDVEHLNDADNWHTDGDYGRTHYERDIGETDRIEIFLLTDRKAR